MQGFFKRLLSFVVSATMLMTGLSTFSVLAEETTEAEDFAKVKNALREQFLQNPSAKHVSIDDAATYLATQNEDGTWDDIDYYDTTNDANGALWQPYLAIHRMQMMAYGYCLPDHELYQNDDVIMAVDRGMAHWFSITDANPNQANFAGP